MKVLATEGTGRLTTTDSRPSSGSGPSVSGTEERSRGRVSRRFQGAFRPLTQGSLESSSTFRRKLFRKSGSHSEGDVRWSLRTAFSVHPLNLRWTLTHRPIFYTPVEFRWWIHSQNVSLIGGMRHSIMLVTSIMTYLVSCFLFRKQRILVVSSYFIHI